jgi:hypothetical protein
MPTDLLVMETVGALGPGGLTLSGVSRSGGLGGLFGGTLADRGGLLERGDQRQDEPPLREAEVVEAHDAALTAPAGARAHPPGLDLHRVL